MMTSAQPVGTCIEPIMFDRARFDFFLAFLDTAGKLSRRETKMIWLIILCVQLPDLACSPEHSSAALRGLQLLIEETDLDYVTHGNPELSRDMLDRIKTTCFRPCPVAV